MTRCWNRALGWHLAALGLLLVGLAPFTRPTVATIDEGSFGAQAQSLQRGSWAFRWPFASLPGAADWFPLSNATMGEGGWYPYSKHPLVPSVMAAFGRVLGADGYVLPSLLGVVGVALVAWLVAARLAPDDPHLARTAFWLAACSPVLFNGFLIWAHAQAAACAGLAVLGAVGLVRADRSAPVSQVQLIAGLSGALLMRSEALLFGLALLGAVGLSVLWGAGGETAERSIVAALRRLPAALVATVPGAVALLVTRDLERRWITAIVGSAPSDLVVRAQEGEPSFVAARFEGIWHSTLSGSESTHTLLIPFALVVVGALVLLRRRQPDLVRLLPVAVVALAAVVALRTLTVSYQLVNGLLPAWPLLVLGGLALRRADLARWSLLIGTSGLFVTAVWATQYADGGAYQWGGRLLGLAIVPLAVVAAAGCRRLVADQGPTAELRGRMVAALVLLGVVSALAGPVALRENRSIATTYDLIADNAQPVMIATGAELPRMLWRYDLDWLHVPVDDLPVALAQLEATGVTTVGVVTPAGRADSQLTAFGSVTARVPVPGTSLEILTVERR